MWKCPTCGEEIEDEFSACWRCAKSELTPDEVKEVDKLERSYTEKQTQLVGRDTHSQPPPLTTKWSIRTADEYTLNELTIFNIVQGIQEGWIRLDDTCCQDENDWQPICSTLGKKYRSIEVFINPNRVYGRKWGILTAPMVGIIIFVSVFLYLEMMVLHLNIDHAITNLIKSIVGLLVSILCIAPVFLILRALLVNNIASVIANVIVLIVAHEFFKFPLGVLTLGIISGALGYGLGYAIGCLAGRIRRNQYKLPENRQPLPDWVTALRTE